MMTAGQYLKSLKDLRINVLIRGKNIGNPLEHPVVQPALNEMTRPYEMAHMPQYEGIGL